MTTAKTCRFCFSIFVSSFILVGFSVANDQILTELKEAWTRRERYFSAGKIEWKQIHRTKKGAYVNPDIEGDAATGGKFLPPNDRIEESTNLLVFDAGKAKYHRNFDTSPGKTRTAIFDGARRAMIDGRATRHNDVHPYANIMKAKKFEEAQMWELQPVIWFLMPMHETLGCVPADRLRLSGDRGMIGEVELLVLHVESSGDPASISEYWVDPNQDFLILRWVNKYAGKTIRQIDASYVPSEEFDYGPLLTTWRYVMMQSDGAPMDTFESKVISWEFNLPIDPREFALDVPAGSVVTDSVVDEIYYVRDDGSKRKILPEELTLTYERVAATNTGDAVASAASESWQWLAVSAFVAFCIVAYLGFRFRRHWS